EISTLPLMESFYTLQGEGFHQGKAAYFIRLAGCDVGCVWCDVKESWDKNLHKEIFIEEIISMAKEHPARIAVITGGEPAMYNLDKLTAGLHQENFATHIETSGAYSLTGQWDWICVSPKKFKSPLPENIKTANELKVIVYNKSDFAWAEKNASLASADCKLYLQPEWSRAGEMTPLIVDYIKQNPGWELSLQIHKYIQVP
ncbi:MAG TPA: 7-carboxy-7-deazaguanine synthase QueE, partial [Chitinophagaceae bacterium]|nr:7-carboxy-7-deazaguanine synthase QueE [Chitinophagaceae bacterium]